MPWQGFDAAGIPILTTRYDYLGPLTLGELSITGATTATINRQHVVTGTAADYTITLPAASGCSGKFLSFRFGPTLTQLSKLVTLDGNASETIDGSLTRICWAGESVVLFCDGSNWFKIAGKSIPMIAGLHLTSNQIGVVTTTVTKIQLNGSDVNNTGMMCDLTNKNIGIVRPGLYNAYGCAAAQSAPTCNRWITALYAVVSGSAVAQISEAEASSTAGEPHPLAFMSLNYIVGDSIELRVYHDAAGDQTAQGGTLASGACFLNVQEVPQW